MNSKKITALILAAASVLTFSSCRLTSIANMIGEAETEPQATAEPVPSIPDYTQYPSEYYPTEAPSSAPVTIPPDAIVTEAPPEQIATQPPVVITTAAPADEPTAPTAPAKPDYASYTTQQILDTYAQALNLTRSYTGNITVHHKEDFTADVKEASPGGALTTQLANTIISKIGAPSETDYRFTGGQAVNEDGDTIPLLLPQKANFSLTADGISRATIEEADGMVHLILRLVPETVGFGEVPKYNSAAIGYLDTASFDFKIVKINSCDINYTGSAIDAYIRPDGYIARVTYTIAMNANGNVSGLGITGSGVLEGAQTESWVLNWE